MSVLKSKRDIAEHEYENSFYILCRCIDTQIQKLPKRRYKTLGKPVIEAVNYAASIIDEMTYISKTPKYEQREIRKELSSKCIESIQMINKKLLIMWCVNDTNIKSINQCDNLLQNTFDRLYELTLTSSRQKVIRCDMNNNNAIYINNIKELAKFTYSKVARMPEQTNDMIGHKLTCCVSDALYSSCVANTLNPEIDADYIERNALLKNALNKLNSMQSAIYTYSHVKAFSENTYHMWSELLCSSIQCVENVITSDNKRHTKAMSGL